VKENPYLELFTTTVALRKNLEAGAAGVEKIEK